MADITYTVEVGLGGVLTDVTGLVEGFECGGGRLQQFDAFTAGSCTFTLEDTTGDYIPGGGGLWSSEVWVGREVVITADVNGTENVLWRGHVEGVDVEVVGMFRALLTVSAADPLARLGRTLIDTGTTFSSELSSVRLTNVLDLPEVDGGVGFFGADERDIAAGSVTFQAETDAGGNTLEYLRTVEKSEGGRLFIAHGRDVGGRLTFRPRAGNSDDSGLTFQDTSDGSGSLVDGGTAATTSFAVTWDGGDASSTMADALDGGDSSTRFEVPYEAVDVAFDSSLLANRMTLQRVGGIEQTAEDAGSQARFGIRAQSESGLLNVSDAAVLELAELRLARAAYPSRTVRGLTVLLDVLSDDQAAMVAGVTVGDRLKVVTSPPGFETNGTISQFVRAESVRHRVSTGPMGTHSVEFRLTTLSDEFGGAVDGGDASTASFVRTWDGGDATTAVFADSLDGGSAIFV